MTAENRRQSCSLAFSQSDDNKSDELDDLSIINQFTPSYSSITQDLGKDVVQRVIDEVLFDQGGEYQGSSTECSSNKPESTPSTGSPRDIGKRINYWQNYLKEHARISEKLTAATGKQPCELLLNKTEEYRKIQQCKRLMDVAERLSPTRLISREPVKLKEVPCGPDIYSKLSLTEQQAKPNITLTEMPTVALQEQGIDECEPTRKSWLRSEYLGDQLVATKDNLGRVIDHYPDMENLQIVGTKIVPTEPKIQILTEEGEAVRKVEFLVTDAWYRDKEPSLEYVLSINGREFDAEKKTQGNVNFWRIFEAQPCQQEIQTLTIRNRGWKAVDIGWSRVKPRRVRILAHNAHIYPAFYFNKNMLRIQPGTVVTVEFVFCCREFGIYEECWEMKLVPKFLAGKSIMTVSLFGHCQQDELDVTKFYEIEHALAERAAAQITKEILYDVATRVTKDPPPESPYHLNFSESELFTLINPNLHYNEDSVEQLKDMYTELKQGAYTKTCKTWRFDIKELKSIILDIPDDIKRKELYVKFNKLIKDMRMKPSVFSPDYKEQKFLLVKNVLLGLADSIEGSADKLADTILATDYDLKFDEVLVKADKLHNHIAVSSEEWSDDNETGVKLVCVVKADLIRKKKQEAFQESLYVQAYGHLCTAVDQIVSIVEGMKNLE